MKIVGMMVVGPGEAQRYLRASLDELKRLCDDVVVCLNTDGKEEREMVKEYGFWRYEDLREWGKDQPRIKTDLLARVGKLNPDWVVAIDADEVFAPEFTRHEAERLAGTGEVAYYFMVVNLYNDKEHFYHGAGIQRFWNVRYFKYAPELGLEYMNKALHCGLAPPAFYKYGWHAPYYLEHYGLMLKEDRMKKAERYKKYDPNAKMKSKVYYDDLIKDHKPQVFDRIKLLQQLKESKETQPRTPPL